MAEDVMDTTGKGFDGAAGGASAFIVDALAFYPILLVGYPHCGFGCHQKVG
jgi:hypothetical protein